MQSGFAHASQSSDHLLQFLGDFLHAINIFHMHDEKKNIIISIIICMYEKLYENLEMNENNLLYFTDIIC